MDLFVKKNGKAGSGIHVILLHGFCEDHTIWDDVLPAFSDCELHLVDLPGFGRSQTKLPLPLTIDWVADQVYEQVIKPLKTKPLVVGHSLGGYVTLGLAERYASSLGGFCLFHSTGHPDPEEKKQTRNKTMNFVNENGVDEFIRQFVPGLFHSTFRREHPEAVQEVVALCAKTPRLTITSYLAAMRDRPDRMQVLEEFAGKKLVVAGEKDGTIPLEQSLALKEIVGEKDFHLLENTAHMGMFERTEESIEALQSFVKA